MGWRYQWDSRRNKSKGQFRIFQTTLYERLCASVKPPSRLLQFPVKLHFAPSDPNTIDLKLHLLITTQSTPSEVKDRYRL